MSLEEIGVFINKSAPHSNPNNIYIFTRLCNLQVGVPAEWSSHIYTTHFIASILIANFRFPKAKIRPLHINKVYIVGVKRLQLALLADHEKEDNVMLFLKSANHGRGTRIIYNGMYCNKNVLKNDTLLNMLRKPTDFLFVDVQSKNNVERILEESTEKVGQTIIEQLILNPSFKVLFWIPQVGCNQLIEHLCSLPELSVYLNGDCSIFSKSKTQNLQSANVIVTHESFSMDDIEKFYLQQNFITVKIVHCEDEPKNLFKSIGLYEVNWSPFPCKDYIYNLVNLVCPKYAELVKIEECCLEIQSEFSQDDDAMSFEETLPTSGAPTETSETIAQSTQLEEIATIPYVGDETQKEVITNMSVSRGNFQLADLPHDRKLAIFRSSENNNFQTIRYKPLELDASICEESNKFENECGDGVRFVTFRRKSFKLHDFSAESNSESESEDCSENISFIELVNSASYERKLKASINSY